MFVKPGYKTTELLVTVLTALGAFAAALTGELQPRWAALAAAISVGAYNIARGLAKRPAVVAPAPVSAVQPTTVAPTTGPQA